MKKIYPFLLLACLSVVAKAQTAATYVFSRTTGTFSSIAGGSGTVSSYTISSDDAVLTNVPIGFSFTYGGNTSTLLSASSNGWMSLSNSALATGTGTYSNSLANLPSNNGGIGVLMPFWDDLNGGPATAYYQTSGTAPNRVFTFQWGEPTAGWGNYTGSGNATFQVKLYESSNVIEFIYGTTTYSGNSASIGIANSGTDYLMLASETSTSASTTFSNSAGASPAANTVMTWTPPPTIVTSPASLTFVEGVGVTSSSQNVSLIGYGLTGTNVTVTAPANYEIYNGTSWVTSMTIPVSTAAVGTYVNTVIPTHFVAPSTAATYTGNLAFSSAGATTVNLPITGYSTLPCGGTPVAGAAAVSPAIGAASTTFTLSLSGYSIAGGITFQWQSSPDNATWTNISGATLASYTVAGITSNQYYRCQVTCGASTSSSASCMAAFLAAPGCTPSYASSPATNYRLDNISLTGYSGSTLNDNGTSPHPSSGYEDRTSAVAPVNLMQGDTYSGSVSYAPSYYYMQNQVWIDFDNDGNFATSEQVTPVFGIGGCYTSIASETFSLTIPTTAAVGYHRMRVRNAMTYSCSNSSSMDPCSYYDSYNYYYYGTSRDYAVNIVPLPVCSGTPSGLSVTASQSFGCTSYSSNLNVTGIAASGYTYQWQSSPDSITWTNVSGATNTSYTASVSVSVYYRCVITCSASSSTFNTAGLHLIFSTTAPIPYTESFESITSNNALPPCMDATNLGYITRTYTSAQGSYNRAARTGSKFGSFRYGSNDWFFTPAFALTAGNTYVFSFWYVTDGYSGWGPLKAMYGTSQSASGMTTVIGTPVAGPMNTTYAQYTGTFTATTSGSFYIGINCNDNGNPWYLSIDDINLTQLPACTGTPSGLAVTSTKTFDCSPYTPVLGLSGIGSSGYTYQWESSPNNTTWSTVSGATDASYSPTVSSSVYYRAVVSCPAGGSAFTTTGLQHVYSPTVALPYSESFEGIAYNNALPPCMDATGLGSYTKTYTAATGYNNMYAHTGSKYAGFGYYANDWFFTPGFAVTAGNSYVVSFWYITDGYSGWNSLSASWGNSQTASGMTTPIGTAISTPSNTTYAQYTATVTATSTGTYYVGINCSNTWGSNLTIDDINVVELPSCSGTPSGISATASQTYGCTSYSSTLSLSGLGSSGFTYQWESSPDNLTWSAVSGATNASYTASVSTSVYYRCVITCTASSSSSATAGIQLVYSVTSAIPYFEGFESITANNTLPPCMDATNLGYITRTYTSAQSSYNRAARTGSKFGSFRYGSNDWFFTPAFALTAGNTYVFSFWYVTDGYSGWGPLKAMYGTSQSATGMTAVIGTPVASPNNTTYAQYTGTFTATSSGNFYVGINCNDNGNPWYLSIDDINLTQLPTCTGAPSGLAVTSTQTYGCSPYTPVVGLSGIGSSGYTYQWESSPDNITWSTVSGATDASYSPTVSSSVYYRAIVSCPAGGSAFTTTGLQHIYTPTVALPYSESFEGIAYNNALPPCMDATGLGSYTKTYTAATGYNNMYAHTGSKYAGFSYYANDWFFTPGFAVTAGNSYVVSFWYITDGYSGWNSLSASWGNSQTASGMTTPIGTPVLYPSNTTYAQYTATVTATSTGTYYVGINCSNTWGSSLSIDDINVVQLPPCSGTPVAGTVSSSVSYGCGTVTPTLSLSGTTSGVSGLGYQWQSSPDNTTWTNMAGATTMTYTPATSATTYYRSEVSCGAAANQSTSTMVSVNPVPATIDGGYFVCLGSTTSLSTTTTGGTWSSSDASTVSVNASGVVSGLLAGTAAISYTLPTGCAAVNPVNVNTVVPTVSASASSPAICSGENVSFNAAPTLTLPTYQFATIPYAPVSFTPTGTITSATTPDAGSNDDGYYSINLPFDFTFYGTTYTAGTTLNIGNNGFLAFGYLAPYTYWYDNVPNSDFPATIALFGRDMYLPNAGTITYGTVGTAPNRQFIVSFNGVADYSTGPNETGMIVLYETSNTVELHVKTAQATTHTFGIQSDYGGEYVEVPGQNYSSASVSNTAWRFSVPQDTYVWSPSTYLASTTGSTVTASAVTGSAPMVYTVTRTYSGCASNTTATVTLNPLPATIMGTMDVCQGLTTALNTASSGGTWQSSIPSNATVDPATGVVMGILAGTSTISYTFTSTGCSNSQVVTVNALPDNILGTAGVCSGSTTTLTDVTMSGTWNSGTPAVASVDASGVVTGGTAGVAMITYTLPTGCIATREATVNPLPSINVTPATVPTICEGESASFSASSPTMEFSLLNQDFNSGLGLWTISTPQDPGDGVSPWTWTTTPISGPGDGSALVEANPAYGSGASVTETILTSPSFSTMGYGSADLTFNQNLQSTSSADLNVEVQYSVDGGATWSILLDEMNAISGTGAWTASSPEISLPLPAAALNVPDVRIRWYYQSNFGLWWQVDNIAVKAALPAATFTWTGVGGATGLSCTNCASATMTPTASGANVYNVTASSTCSSNTNVTVNVNPLPGVITSSAATLCVGNTVTLSSPDAGGTWASDNVAIATVDPVTGEATGIAMGSVVISYTLPTTCARMVTLNVDPSPAPITGTLQVCTGLTTALTNTVTGGVWTNSGTDASIDATTGVVTGNTAGTSMITYELPSGCKTSSEVTVNALPAPITGVASVCIGSSTSLSSAPTGGTWNVATIAPVTVGSTGIVTGVTAGVTEVTYTLPGGCRQTAMVTANALPSVYYVTGTGSYCAGGTGTPVGLTLSQTGVDYQLYMGTTPVGAPVTGTGSAITFGSQLAGTYTVAATNSATCVGDMGGSAVITATPISVPSVTVATTPAASVCAGTVVTFAATPVNGGTLPVYDWYVNGLLVSGTAPATYSYAPASGDVIEAILHSNAACATPSTATYSTTVTVNPNETPVATIAFTGATSVCAGNSITLGATSVFGGSTPVYHWMVNGTVMSTGASYSYVPAAGDIVTCELTSNFTCVTSPVDTSNALTMAVTPVYIPILGLNVTPGSVIVSGTSVTFTAAVAAGTAGPSPTYQWYKGSAAIGGATNSTYTTTTIVDNDSITCKVTGTAPCGEVAFNSVVMKVKGVGVQQVTGNISNVRLVPNPNNGEFILTGTLSGANDDQVAVEITNMLGQTVYSGKFIAKGGSINEKIQLSNTLANGMYMLNMHAGSQMEVIHFVLEQ